MDRHLANHLDSCSFSRVNDPAMMAKHESVAFVDAASNLRPDDYGESFNIGSGRKTTIAEVADEAHALFQIGDAPAFTMPSRSWDVREWFADISKARERLGWEPRATFRVRTGVDEPDHLFSDH